MCDEITEADNATHLTRRQLGASAGAVGMAALLPTSADAKPVKGRDVTITTPDGQCDAYFTAPASGKHPGVLMWPDIMGLRPAFRQMADRLAGEGAEVTSSTPEEFASLIKNDMGKWARVVKQSGAHAD